MTYIYSAFGLTISSEFCMPELECAKHQESIDLLIQKTDLRPVWEQIKQDTKRFVVHNNVCYFEVPNLAIYAIKDGTQIYVSPMDGVEENRLRIYLLSSCMAAVLIQRQILPLHGSAIEIDGKAYGIVGSSGAGKSTIGSAFLRKGYPLISDDLIAITFNKQHIPYVTPAFPQQKLWHDSLHYAGMDAVQYNPLVNGGSKYAIPINEQFVKCPLPLHGIIELIKTKEQAITWKPVNSFDRVRLLYKHTFRKSILFQYDLIQWHFELMTRLGENVPMFQLKRPMDRFTATELASTVLRHMTEGGEEESGKQNTAASIG
ncbi:aldolase [Virgibacillus sp. W0430]|uniref:aldolase n=1 Tax=Virgibacillus sp. W0430 TaxID=3391580 RepID=UPI003F44E644